MRRRRPRIDDSIHPPPIPIEYAGQWVALDPTLRHVLASGLTFAEVRASAEELGHAKFVMARGPRKDRATFIGGNRFPTIGVNHSECFGQSPYRAT